MQAAESEPAVPTSGGGGPNPALPPLIASLTNDGFACRENVMAEGRTFALVAEQHAIKPTKFAKVSTFWIVEDLSEPDLGAIRRFSSDAYRYALTHKRTPPRGFFGAVVCVPVALVRNVDAAAAESLMSSAAPKHWSAFEFPVVADLERHELLMFQGTPFWGAAYYRGFRAQAHARLDQLVQAAPVVAS